MNFRDLLATAIGNTFRSRLRTTLTVIAIFIGAFTLTITTAIGAGVSHYIDTQVASLGSSDVMIVTKSADAAQASGSGPAKYDPKAATSTGGFRDGPAGPAGGVLDRADLAKIAAINGIRSVDPLSQVTPSYIQYSTHGKFQVTVNPAGGLIKADLAAGAQLSATGGSEVILPTSYIDTLGFQSAQAAIGKTVTFGLNDYQGVHHTAQATVVGVQNQSLIAGGVSLNQTLTSKLAGIQASGRPAALNEGHVAATARISPHATTSQVNRIKHALTNDGFTGQTVADQLGVFTSVIGGITGVLDAFAIIALIAAGFGIINTLLMSVQERTREIGLMKAVGMGGGKVYALFSLEAVFIGFLGSAIGAAVAIGAGIPASNALSDTVLSGLPGLNILQFTPTGVATIILVVMAIAFLAGTLPARRAARQNPIDALRTE